MKNLQIHYKFVHFDKRKIGVESYIGIFMIPGEKV